MPAISSTLRSLVLAPSAARLRLTERLNQPAGLGLKLLHLLGDRLVVAGAFLLKPLHLSVELLQLLTDRLDERLDGLLPRLQFLVGAGLVPVEALADQGAGRIRCSCRAHRRRAPRIGISVSPRALSISSRRAAHTPCAPLPGLSRPSPPGYARARRRRTRRARRRRARTGQAARFP